MKAALLTWVFCLVGLIILGIFGFSACSEIRTRELNAQANLVVAEARADAIRQAANAALVAATTPVVVFGGIFIVALISIFGLGVLGLKVKRNTKEVTKEVVREVVYLNQPQVYSLPIAKWNDQIVEKEIIKIEKD